MEQRGFFILSEHLEKLSEHGDPLEVLDATVDFEYFNSVYKPVFVLFFIQVQSHFKYHKWLIIFINTALLFKMNCGCQSNHCGG